MYGMFFWERGGKERILIVDDDDVDDGLVGLHFPWWDHVAEYPHPKRIPCLRD